MSDATASAAGHHPTATREVRPALIAAVFVVSYLVFQDLLGLVVWSPGGGNLGPVGLAQYVLTDMVVPNVAFAAGVFLVLWLWPVAAGDRILLTLAKAGAASAAGGVVSAIVSFMALAFTAGLWNITQWRYLDTPYIFSGVIGTAIAYAPLVMLVVVLQQQWNRGAFRA